MLDDDNDWHTPAVPTEEGLPDNTDEWGPFYFWKGEVPARQWFLSFAITREILPPWRRGGGLVVRWNKSGRPFGYAVGIWKKGKPPRILTMEPREEDLKYVVRRARRLATLPDHGDIRDMEDADG